MVTVAAGWVLLQYGTGPIYGFAVMLLVGIATIAGVVYVEQAQRRIPVQYAKRMVGRRMYGGTSSASQRSLNK